MSRHSKHRKPAISKAIRKAVKKTTHQDSITHELAVLNAYLAGAHALPHSANLAKHKPVPNIYDISHQPDPPIRHNANDDTFLKQAESKLDLVLRNGYAPQTNKNYSYAIRRFLDFSAKCGIPAADALPASPKIVSLFIANGVGTTSESTARGNLSAIAAWHRINGFPFETPPQITIIKKGIRALWPGEKQKKAPRKPISPGMMLALIKQWRTGSPKELCALAIALAAWCGIARLGELLPPSASEVDAKRLPRRNHWTPSPTIPNCSSISLPWTKTTLWKGATICLLPQKYPFDPSLAIATHLMSSPLPSTHLLCEYQDSHTTQVLDKFTFMLMANAIWKSHGWPSLSGHSFRIGGTTTYLRAGVDPKVVKKMGRWTSDAFLLYWRNTEEIFASHASNLSWVDFAI
jgi:hypothetical protein